MHKPFVNSILQSLLLGKLQGFKDFMAFKRIENHCKFTVYCEFFIIFISFMMNILSHCNWKRQTNSTHTYTQRYYPNFLQQVNESSIFAIIVSSINCPSKYCVLNYALLYLWHSQWYNTLLQLRSLCLMYQNGPQIYHNLRTERIANMVGPNEAVTTLETSSAAACVKAIITCRCHTWLLICISYPLIDAG